MDLTKIATDAAAEKERRERRQREAAAELAVINTRAQVRERFKTLLGIDVPEDDVISGGRGDAGVIVDGHRLALYSDKARHSADIVLQPTYVHDDGTFTHLDTSCHGGGVTNLESLGRVLGAVKLSTSGRDPWWVSGELKAYYIGRGWATHWRDGKDVTPPEFLEGT